jgi:hypothetical protein
MGKKLNSLKKKVKALQAELRELVAMFSPPVKKAKGAKPAKKKKADAKPAAKKAAKTVEKKTAAKGKKGGAKAAVKSSVKSAAIPKSKDKPSAATKPKRIPGVLVSTTPPAAPAVDGSGDEGSAVAF